MGDGMDAHSWWPLFENIPTEYLESYYPITVLEYGSLMDTGGAGFHRGGNAVHKVYRYEADGEIAIHDDRERSKPWGIMGGLPGATSTKKLVRTDGTEENLASKISRIPVKKGDILIYQTAGGGGWKDPLDRPAEKVQKDVRNGLVSIEKAQSDYGVVLNASDFSIDETATNNLRAELREKRGEFPLFSIGEVPEAIGVVAEWYRLKSNGANGNSHVETDKSIATTEYPQTSATGAGSTVLPV
jgi:N-methylhydantoinase B